LRLKILKKLRTTSLNSGFTGPYKKGVAYLFNKNVIYLKTFLDILELNLQKFCLSVSFNKKANQSSLQKLAPFPNSKGYLRLWSHCLR